MNMIEIWSPRYHDNVVLIALRRVVDGDNFIKFTKAKHLKGKIFTISGEEIRSCPRDSNGKIMCYAVPMNRLKQVDTHTIDRKA